VGKKWNSQREDALTFRHNRVNTKIRVQRLVTPSPKRRRGGGRGGGGGYDTTDSQKYKPLKVAAHRRSLYAPASKRVQLFDAAQGRFAGCRCTQNADRCICTFRYIGSSAEPRAAHMHRLGVRGTHRASCVRARTLRHVPSSPPAPRAQCR